MKSLKTQNWRSLTAPVNLEKSIISSSKEKFLSGSIIRLIMTPYGYGGPLVLRAEAGREKELFGEYQKALDSFLRENHIVCEFVRFHPVRNNAAVFSEMYTLWNPRKAVCTDCAFEDPIKSEFHPDTARRIRKALKNGVATEIFTRPNDAQIQQFVACYYANMDRIQADRYYYFDEDYFHRMCTDLNDRLILVFARKDEEIIGADLGFSDGDLYIRHLSGVTDLGNRLDAARAMAGAQVQWAAENGYKYVFHGCGLSRDENDPLFNFKRFFTKGSFFQYFQGKRIVDPLTYHRICEMAGKADDGSYFPLYRKP